MGLWSQRDGPLSQADMAASCTCDSQTEVLRGYIFDAKHKAERKLKVGWDYELSKAVVLPLAGLHHLPPTMSPARDLVSKHLSPWGIVSSKPPQRQTRYRK